tara:strand:- start:72 stop:329 length:258 start_codon:yes stop_codon:yes gene_type:complete
MTTVDTTKNKEAYRTLRRAISVFAQLEQWQDVSSLEDVKRLWIRDIRKGAPSTALAMAIRGLDTAVGDEVPRAIRDFTFNQKWTA